MRYTVDRIENNVVILENRETLEMMEVPKDKIPFSVHDGSILIYKDGQYIESVNEELDKRKKIEERFKRLRDI